MESFLFGKDIQYSVGKKLEDLIDDSDSSEDEETHVPEDKLGENLFGKDGKKKAKKRKAAWVDSDDEDIT